MDPRLHINPRLGSFLFRNGSEYIFVLCVLDGTGNLAVPAPDTQFRLYKNRFHTNSTSSFPNLPGREPLITLRVINSLFSAPAIYNFLF
jgi:hypothetical protein